MCVGAREGAEQAREAKPRAGCRPPSLPARREEGEKFNVWVAYLNLEDAYGSEEGVLALLGRALTHADARRVYLAAVDVFERSGRGPLVEQCLKAMTRKFSQDPEVWWWRWRWRPPTGGN